MSRKAGAYLIVATLLALAAYGVHRVKGSGPTQVAAHTLFLGDASTTVNPRTVQARTVRKSPDPAQVMELPEAARSLITGEGALDSASYFKCWVTNGSSWTVTELGFNIAAGQPEGSTRWERHYTERVQLPPGTVSHISFKVTDGRNAETRWNVFAARGVPSK